MSEFEIVKTAGPVGLGIFAVYLIIKEIFGYVKTRNENRNGNGLKGSITAKMFETLIELKTESVKQTGLLEKLVKKESNPT